MGYQVRECIVGLAEERDGSWKATKWAWRSCGPINREGHKVEVRKCLGVYQCKCGKRYRPGTDKNAREKLERTPCDRCLTCPILHMCKAETHHFKIKRNGDLIAVFQHHGEHLHPRPPGGRLSRQEQSSLDDQVFRRHDATAHQLRTGDNGPGSIPLHQISPSLTDPSAAHYQVAKSRERLGVNLSASRGGLGILHALGNLNKEFEVPFIVESQLHGPTYICLQTPFMRRIIKEVVESWIQDGRDGPAAARHGFVTDGDHSFFQHGVLLISCAFSASLSAWVPVLYTWIDGQDTDHHRPHFRRIFKSVIEYAGAAFESKLLLHVRNLHFCSLTRIIF